MTRSIEARLDKLEASSPHADEMLLIWRTPEEDKHAVITAAAKANLFSSGDCVLCGDWIGESAKPAPRWISRIPEDVNEAEMACLWEMANKLVGTKMVRSTSPDNDLVRYTDEQLWTAMLAASPASMGER